MTNVKRIAAALGASAIVLFGAASCATGEREQPRPPSIGDVAESKLGHRIRELEAHLQCTRGRQREIQIHDEQRKQRREDVAEAVDDEMSRCQDHDRGMEPQQTGFHRIRRRLSRRDTRARYSLNSRMRSSHDAAPSTTSDTPMVMERRTTCFSSSPPGHRVSSI